LTALAGHEITYCGYRDMFDVRIVGSDTAYIPQNGCSLLRKTERQKKFPCNYVEIFVERDKLMDQVLMEVRFKGFRLTQLYLIAVYYFIQIILYMFRSNGHLQVEMHTSEINITDLFL
jgi:hypothetical protein